MKQQILGALLTAASLSATAAGAATVTSAATLVPATQTVKFSVFLPLQNTAAMKTLLAAQQTKGSPSYHKWLTPQQVAAQFGPSAATFASAEAALTGAGLTVTKVHMRSIDVSGPASAVNKTLQVALRSIATGEGGTRVIATTRLIMPQALTSTGAIIPTFISVPEHKPASQRLGSVPDNRKSPVGGYNYNDLKQAYDYPAYTALDGTGAHVGIVMESNASNADVTAMFNNENFTATTGKAPPSYTYIPIDGGGTFGGINDGGTDEAELDVQMVLGGAPGAKVDLLSIPDLSDQSIIDAYITAVEDGSYHVISSSFGGCELFYTPPYNNGYDFTSTLALYDEIFEFGNLEGITFVASSGDSGGLGCPSVYIVPHFVANFSGPPVNFIPGVENPASDPNVTGVGGGNLVTTFNLPSLNSAYISEQAYGDPEVPYDAFGVGVNISGGYWGAGGGVSKIFAQPAYQTLVNTNSSISRTVPDIGMLVGGCPGGISVLPCGNNRAYVFVTISGTRYGFIGTSVAAPEFAGALALLVQANGGPLGNINPALYTLGAIQTAAGGVNAPPASQFYHTNTPGFDGYYHSTAQGGYNYIFGNGSPDIRKLFGLTSTPAAGVPQTPSNP